MECGELEVVVVDGYESGEKAGEDEEESGRPRRLPVGEDSVKSDADGVNH